MAQLLLGPTTYLGPTAILGDGVSPTGQSFTATAQPDNRPPRMLLEAQRITGTTATIVRVGPDGKAVPVRTGNPAALSTGTWIGYDYEPPYNQAVTYILTPSDGSASLTSTYSGAQDLFADIYTDTFGTPGTGGPLAVLDVEVPWLIHPGVPDLSQQITVRSLGANTSVSSGALHPILSSQFSSIVTDGQRKAPTFDLELKTATAQQLSALEDLLQDTSPLLLQMVYPFTAESVYRWVFVGDVVETRKSGDFGDPSRFWSLPCTVVDRPLGNIQSQWNLAAVNAAYPTLAAVQSAFQTLRGLQLDAAGT